MVEPSDNDMAAVDMADDADPAPAIDEGPVLRVGISSCLLGEEVRFDGGHKRDRFLVHTLGPYIQWFPLCPEVEIGMGIPRETIRLVGDQKSPRLLAPKSGTDYTDRMTSWSREQMATIASWDLHGYVLKRASPSCGLFRVKVYTEAGMPGGRGRGLFAAELVRRFPLLPVEEEGRLHDPRLRENFIARLFVHERWQRFLAEDPTPRGLVAFHTRHKLTLLAHSPKHYRELGRLVAEAGARDFDELTGEYATLMAHGMRQIANRGRHANVLHHLLGFFKKSLTAADRQELLATIEDFRKGLLPLIVPITLLRHHIRAQDVPEWVDAQVYLRPYPKELMLRNHV